MNQNLLLVSLLVAGVWLQLALPAASQTVAGGSVSALATGPDATASVFSSAVASGGATALANAISEAASKGEARAVAEAILETVDEENKEAVAEAVAKVTGESPSTVLDELQQGDVNGIAEAVALSTGGKTTAFAEAASTAVADSKSAIVKAITVSIVAANRGEDVDAQANVAAKAIGEAVAQAYARAEVLLEVEGSGEAYGGAQADVKAVAQASATAIAEAFAQASNGVGVASAKIVGEAVTTVIADAAASAFANADLQGPGKVEAIQETLADAIAIPMAQVIGDAFAVVFKGSSEGSTYVESETFLDEEASTTSQGTSSTGGSSSTGSVEGTADAGTTQTVDVATSETETSVNAPPPECKTMARVCCEGRGRLRTLCGCRRGITRATCTFEREDSKDDITTAWKTISSGEVCSC